MLGRRQFAIAGVSALATASMNLRSVAQDASEDHDHEDHDHTEKGHGHHRKHKRDMKHYEKCAQACSDCQRACNSCSTHCGHMVLEGKKQHIETLESCLDCADICAVASQVVARGGPYSGMICTACADACADCAKLCEQHPDDAHMAACAKECRRCEKACRDMLTQLGTHDHSTAE